MSEKYIPSEEETADAEGRMSGAEIESTEHRMELSPEQVELAKKCNLRMEVREYSYNPIIAGEVDGHTISFGGSFGSYVDGLQLENSIAKKLYEKYLPIATFMSEDKKLDRDIQNEKLKEKDLRSSTEIAQQLLEI